MAAITASSACRAAWAAASRPAPRPRAASDLPRSRINAGRSQGSPAAAPASRTPTHRRQVRALAAGGGSNGSGGSLVAASSDYAALAAHKVYSADSGQAVELTSLWRPEPGTRCVVALFTHFADLSSTEFAQKLLPLLPELNAAGVGFLAVGLGEVDKARRFSELLNFPLDQLYADPTGELYTALGFNPGFAPEVNVSPYAKLLPMLAGIGSPGTIQEVLRGYVGDRSAKPVFGGESNLFNVLGSGYQRPFELATLRLFNMQLVLSHWNELAPSDGRLLTQQGGCLAFNGTQTLYRHADAGILKYADVDEVLKAVLPAGGPVEPPASQVLRPLV